MATFRPREHIRRRAEFEQIYGGGTKVSGRFMTLMVKANHGHPRLGIAATRKIGGAVIRNRAKRLTRELFRHHKPSAGLDIVIVPRREFLDAPYSTLQREFIALLDRAGRTSRRPADAAGGGSGRARVDTRV